MNRIPFAIPDIGEEEIEEVVKSLKSGWITTGPKTQEFEKNFSKYVGSQFALAVNSATSGLHLALDAIGLKRNDEVIVPVNTFTATAEVVRYFDAHPIFCDINADTFNICILELRRILGSGKYKNLKAIIPVHIAGQACEMEEIISLAREYNLKVIEDAAHALPTTYKGTLIGTLSDITVFSFYATKTICTGEGGMITTDNEEYAKRIKVMRLHGFDRDAWNRYNSDKPSWYYSIVAPGYKYNMTDIAASMGIHQLNKLDHFFNRRKEIADMYNKAFKKEQNIITPKIVRTSDKHAYHLYIIKVNNRNKLIEKLNKKGIGTSVHFIPLHLQPYWKEKYNFNEIDYPIALKNFEEIVSLPIHTKLSNQDVDYIIDQTIQITNELSGL